VFPFSDIDDELNNREETTVPECLSSGVSVACIHCQV